MLEIKRLLPPTNFNFVKKKVVNLYFLLYLTKKNNLKINLKKIKKRDNVKKSPNFILKSTKKHLFLTRENRSLLNIFKDYYHREQYETFYPQLDYIQ